MTKKSTKEKDVIDQILDQLDLHGMTQEELFGADGLEFEPEIVKKHERRLPLFNEQIISLYSRGMTTRDIQSHLKEIYDVDVSPELISNVTDAVHEDVRAWRTRSLESMYPIVYLDAVRVNSRESGKSVNKALYIALAITMEGKKDVLGFYLSDNEGAKFWMGVLTDLRNREVLDGRAYGPEEPRSAGHTHRLHGWAHGLP